ncbi:flagellar basal-body rod protein FlgF [Rhodohalobacter mucosus]|uniref:Flagellar hook protein FlgE n=1 Tax=Rhodohalobacter mucosus TaxID=2079485 RepID=A0A316TLC8_9BACT|nr:flagellar basal-body rod protein FlgF [Rhodohalobacter mucosus]PWN05180.1 flagellar basal-body rod protein FlgF [Rhodohalobacter mucosus]
MSLMKSLNSGISGLRAFQTKMDVIGNNIANVDTIGFKSSRITFSEMLSQQISSGQGSSSSPQAGAQVGLGVRISAIERDFNQGGLQTTGRRTDVAIEGNGFFMVNEGDQPFLTRAGNFAFNKDGFLVDQSGRSVQGFNADPQGNIIAGGATEDVRIDFENILPPQSTQNVYVAGNLNADTSLSKIIQSQTAFTTAGGAVANGTTLINDLSQTTAAFAPGDTIDFEVTLNDGSAAVVSHTIAGGDTLDDLVASLNAGLAGEGSVTLVDGIMVLRSDVVGESDLAVGEVTTTGTGDIRSTGFQVTQNGVTGSKTVSTTVYDELGRAHTLVVNLTHEGENQWSYEASFLDGQEVLSGGSGVLEFDETGNLVSDNSFGIEFDPGDGANPVTFSLSLGNPETGSAVTQYAGSSSAKVTSQDGYGEGRLVDFSIDGDGNVNGVYSNGRNVTLAQLAIATVANNNGLETVGGGMFRNTLASGEITINTAADMASTSMAAGVLEGSNVDLAREFTDMITAQRAYQSNARIITTADELLTEAVNLKR